MKRIHVTSTKFNYEFNYELNSSELNATYETGLTDKFGIIKPL